MATTCRYGKHLPKDDIKRLSKEVTKKLVRGDFKAGRVKDPTAAISSKHEKTIKNFVKEFMDKAVKKKEERDKGKALRKSTESNGDVAMSIETESPETPQLGSGTRSGSVMEDQSPAESSGAELKRKREEDNEAASPKKFRSDSEVAPPPPPPPAGEIPVDAEGSALTPMDDDLGSMDMTGDSSVNGIRPKALDNLASPTQLATPPTKEHSEYQQQRAVSADSKP